MKRIGSHKNIINLIGCCTQNGKLRIMSWCFALCWRPRNDLCGVNRSLQPGHFRNRYEWIAPSSAPPNEPRSMKKLSKARQKRWH